MKNLAYLAITILLAAFCALSGCAAQDKAVTDSLAGPLDTVSTVTAYGAGAAGAVTGIFDAIRDIDARMSAVSPDSELAKVDAGAGGYVAVSDDTFAIVEKALAISAATDGAFDPTIRPVVELWGIGGENERLPSPAEISDALGAVGFRRVALDEAKSSVSLAATGMALDLGGIAKGYACDAAVGILKRDSIRHALLDLGGNIYAHGTKPDGSPWSVGVKTPLAGETGYFCILRLTDKAVVTSGAYERFFEQDGKKYHHIFDPANGYPADSGLLSVTIVAESATDADALSTACFVMGEKRGRGFLEGLDGVEGIFVTEGMEVFATSGLAGEVEIVDERFRLMQEDEY